MHDHHVGWRVRNQCIGSALTKPCCNVSSVFNAALEMVWVQSLPKGLNVALNVKWWYIEAYSRTQYKRKSLISPWYLQEEPQTKIEDCYWVPNNSHTKSILSLPVGKTTWNGETCTTPPPATKHAGSRSHGLWAEAEHMIHTRIFYLLQLTINNYLLGYLLDSYIRKLSTRYLKILE